MTEPSSTPPLPPAPAPDPTETLGTAASRAVLPLVRLFPPPPDCAILAPPDPPDPTRRSWFVAQLWGDLRLAVRMYFDPRYRISRTAQVAFPLFAALVALDYFLFSVWFSVAVVSPAAERLFDLAVGAVAYRMLLRELDRYRAVLDYLARYRPQ